MKALSLFQGRWPRLAAVAGMGWLLQTTPAQAQCTQLVWQDEFNTPGDLSKWQVYEGDGCETGNCNFGNAELQVYRPANATVAGGNLNIATRYEPSVQSGRTYDYTSAKLYSKQASGALQTFKYGRIEARMKLPSAQGVWPAFWMLADPGNWPTTGEIDIMEAKHRNPTKVSGTIHYDAGGWHYTGRDYTSAVDLSQDFHVYAVEWGPEQIQWLVDGVVFHTASPSTTVGGSWPFSENNFYIILNAAVGGPGTGFTGYQNATPSDFPTTTQVDYVRVYKGSFSYAVLGAGQVYQGDSNKTYRLDAIAGASYAWTVPSGATIVSGQGTSAVQVNFGSGATTGNISATVTVNGCPTGTYSKAVTVQPALQLDRVYEDFESNRVVTYGVVTGALTQAVNNPAATGGNTSAKVGQYVRNTSEQYDVLYVRNLGIRNANDFVTGRRKVYVDVYSTAPVGSKVTMQFENSQATTATNFPTGRHSAYKAFTTRQNAWETLEFEFERSLDAGTNIYAIDNVAFLFQPATNSGATFYFDNLLIKQKPDAPVVATDVLLNYDGAARISFDPAITGGSYTPNFANPSATGVNTSANVARYVRNPAEQYDVLFFDAGVAGTVIEDAALFKNQTYQLQFDVYSTAPVGTPVGITLQNKAAAAGAYPAGRNSTYLANTTRQNQWETLTFAYNTTPDGGTANVGIDQLAILFNSGVASGDTYYIDNIRVAKRATPTYTAGTVFENYDTVRNLPLRTATGTYVAAANNPAATGLNTSAKVAQYTRNPTSQYDALTLTSTLIKDGAAYESGQKVFAMDVYTSAPVGTPISWQLENSTTTTPSNYPTGRHSSYQAVVKQTNAWHTVTFSYAGSPDAGTADTDVDNVVLLFAPNTLTGTVFYFDNLRSLTAVSSQPNAAPTVSLTSPAGGTVFTSPANITLNATAADADGTVSKVEFYNGTTKLGEDLSSPYTCSWANVPAGTYSLTAKATDNAGAVTTSAAVSVTVGATPSGLTIPGTLEAENYTAMLGVQLEATGDTGGGQNVGWIDTGDYLDYAVNVQTAGTYTVGFRVASVPGGGQVQLRSATGTVYATASIAATGGWQTWSTVNATATLPAGAQTLRVYVAAGGWNLNWVSFTSASNAAPTVSLTSPAGGTAFTSPANITLNATAADVDGTVSKVEFYNGPTKLGEDLSSPYTFSWANVPVGAYSLTAKATDNAGAVTTSAAVSVTVSTAPPATTNLALNKSVTVSSVENVGTPAPNAVDGNSTTRWSSASGAAPQWIYVDLGATYAVNRVKLLWEAAYATDYLVQISPDAATWTSLRTVTGNSSLTNDLTGLSGTGRYVRIYCQTRALPYGYSLYEFEVYGTAATSNRALASTRVIAPEARLYPNPVSRLLKVPIASAGVLTITDALGRVAHTQTVSAQQPVAEIDVQSLQPGLYFLTLRDANGVSPAQQFIKQ